MCVCVYVREREREREREISIQILSTCYVSGAVLGAQGMRPPLGLSCSGHADNPRWDCTAVA